MSTLPNEVIARALYAEEKRRAEHANALIGATGECIEPYEECADSCWRNDADAALSALEAAGWVCVPMEALDEGVRIVEKLTEQQAYSDSYGVHGSDFYVCHACQEGGAPGAWNGHKDTCPVLAAETWITALLTASNPKEDQT